MYKYSFILLSLLLAFFIPESVAQENEGELFDMEGRYEIDEDASSFEFEISNMGLFSADGTMDGIKGSIDFDKIDSDGFVYLSLDAKTIDTGIEKRDDHLRTSDFFYVEKYPKIEYKGGKLTRIKGNLYVVSGTLSMRGVSLSKKVPIRFETLGNTLKFSGTAEIDRTEYGVDGGSTVGDIAEVTYIIVAK
jgi:polyisoprenoid-binding protein YceI